MKVRKRDDLTGYLYRVVERPAGSNEEWVPSNCGHYTRRPRTYMTLGTARGQKSSAPTRGVYDSPPIEYAVQRAPVTDWEMVPDDE